MASKGSGARTKGSNFELKVAKQLTEWAKGPVFSRTFNSGAFSSTHGKLTSSGDIETEAFFPFSLELKNHETFTSVDTLFHSQAVIQSFWKQNIGDAVRVHKVPMLITHRNRSKAYVTLPYSDTIRADFKKAGLDYGIFNLRWTHDALGVDFQHEVITVVLDDLLATYSYQDLIDLHEAMFADWYHEMDTDKDLQGVI